MPSRQQIHRKSTGGFGAKNKALATATDSKSAPVSGGVKKPHRSRLDVAHAPAFGVGDCVSLSWPMESHRCTAQIVSLKKKRIHRKRSISSNFVYLLQWHDGSPPHWSRLLHLNPQLQPRDSAPEVDAASHLEPPARLPWDCDDGDHCETPALAYAHIAPILSLIRSSIGVNGSIKLYDPYFCAGSAATHLRALGYPDVFNRPVDFYAAQSSLPPRIPPFDVLVSNPPFSSDHPRRSMTFALESRRPFFLLLPNFEACSSWLLELLTSCGHSLLYLAPHKRYVCRSPSTLRCGSNKALKYVAPFPLLWFIGFPDSQLRSQVLDSWRASLTAPALSAPSPPLPTSWPSSSDIALVTDWQDLPAASRPRGAKDSPDALFKSSFNDFCRSRSLGKVCAQFAFTRQCSCSAASPFIHEPPPPVHLLAEFLRVNAAMQPPASWSPLRPEVDAQIILR
jgi:hypothetical protein